MKWLSSHHGTIDPNWCEICSIFFPLGFEISQIVSVWDLVLSEFFQNDIVKLRLISTWFE